MQRALLELARRGDEEAFADLARAVGHRVHLFDFGNSASAPLWSLDSWKTVLGGVTLDPTGART